MPDLNCSQVIDSPRGKLYVIDRELTYDDAINYCQDHYPNGDLASFHHDQHFKEAEIKMDECGSTYFHAGLKMSDGQGTWRDGTVYNETIHEDKFLIEGDGCTVFDPSFYGLSNERCTGKFGFVCVEGDVATTTMEATTTASLTPTTSTLGEVKIAGNPIPSSLLPIFLSLGGLFIVFMFLLICLYKRGRQQRRDFVRLGDLPRK